MTEIRYIKICNGSGRSRDAIEGSIAQSNLPQARNLSRDSTVDIPPAIRAGVRRQAGTRDSSVLQKSQGSGALTASY